MSYIDDTFKNTYYLVKEEGAKIGRNTQNQVII